MKKLFSCLLLLLLTLVPTTLQAQQVAPQAPTVNNKSHTLRLFAGYTVGVSFQKLTSQRTAWEVRLRTPSYYPIIYNVLDGEVRHYFYAYQFGDSPVRFDLSTHVGVSLHFPLLLRIGYPSLAAYVGVAPELSYGRFYFKLPLSLTSAVDLDKRQEYTLRDNVLIPSLTNALLQMQVGFRF